MTDYKVTINELPIECLAAIFPGMTFRLVGFVSEDQHGDYYDADADDFEIQETPQFCEGELISQMQDKGVWEEWGE